MKSIQGMMSATTNVKRDGQSMQILTVDLVPGDVVELALGEKVPADLRLLSVSGIRVDQSILTGESEPIALRVKATSDNFLESKNVTFCGASVVEGSGTGLVIATGNHTVMGSIAAKCVLSFVSSTYVKFTSCCCCLHAFQFIDIEICLCCLDSNSQRFKGKNQKDLPLHRNSPSHHHHRMSMWIHLYVIVYYSPLRSLRLV
jgi:P-type E1-E2 ATPase